MQSAEERLQKSVNELLDGILCCNDRGYNIPALILTYAGIDFVASLDRPDPEQGTTKAEFIKWVEKYLLPSSQVKCSALDLYAARCGWLHTHTSKADLVAQEKAKEVFYEFGPFDNEDQMQRAIKDPSVAGALHFTRLFNAFRDGLDKWETDFRSNKEHQTRVLRNSEKLLHTLRRSY